MLLTSLFVSPEVEYGLHLYKHCYSRNVFHPNEESRKKEARNLYCLVNRQFPGGYKTLVPIYCTAPSSHPLPLKFAWVAEGGRGREENSYHLPWERFDHFPHILTWQHPANREERAIFLSKITVCQYFLSGETLCLLTSVSLRGWRKEERRSLADCLLLAAVSSKQKPSEEIHSQGTAKKLSITYKWFLKRNQGWMPR